MAKVEVRYIDRTCLERDAYIKTVQKYANDLKYDVSIVFDKRLVNYGTHMFIPRKKIHIIRLSPKKNKTAKKSHLTVETVRIGCVGEKFNLIASTIHELKHAQQSEKLGEKFWDENWGYVSEIKNPEISEWYSECEIEARIYENKNIRSAVKLYDSYCKG